MSQIGQMEVDINQFNILELGCIDLSSCSQFEQVRELVRTGFLHMSGGQNQG